MNIERHAILTIRDASKLDSGPYRITAENELGQDTAIINIEISGNIVLLTYLKKKQRKMLSSYREAFSVT